MKKCVFHSVPKCCILASYVEFFPTNNYYYNFNQQVKSSIQCRSTDNLLTSRPRLPPLSIRVDSNHFDCIMKHMEISTIVTQFRSINAMKSCMYDTT